jgi:hypothetical protein
MSTLVPITTAQLLDGHTYLNILASLFSQPPHIVNMRINAYKREMRAVNATRAHFEKLLADGKIRDDMTAEELSPAWEAELERNRYLY